jgi:hypothetical protein
MRRIWLGNTPQHLHFSALSAHTLDTLLHEETEHGADSRTSCENKEGVEERGEHEEIPRRRMANPKVR